MKIYENFKCFKIDTVKPKSSKTKLIDVKKQQILKTLKNQILKTTKKQIMKIIILNRKI